MIEINYQNEYNPEYDKYYKKYQEIALVTLKQLELTDTYSISVILIDDNRIQEINRDYRQVDKATDVISFENNIIDPFDQVIDLGDIFISVDKALEQAYEYMHSVEREMMFLFVHGLLHCLGYDHINKVEEKEMIAIQKVVFDTYEKEEYTF